MALSGERTLNNFFYKPAIGASGVEEKTEFDNALDDADAQIKANLDALANKLEDILERI